MILKLYNSLDKKKQCFKPLNKVIGLYSCGPTVYDHPHIGNIASYIYIDLIGRALRYFYPDHRLVHVMNITDVDDKTIARAHQDYPDLSPKKALTKVAHRYENVFMRDIRRVGIDTASIKFVRATENITAMQDMIRKILEHGYAYVAEDGIYFSLASYLKSHRYGLLENLKPDSAKARIISDEYDKQESGDFALWKSAKNGEPAWDFDLNGTNLTGRPGWHIECSAMSSKYLPAPIDIHTGGVDLKFPHHENEIAQTVAATSRQPFCRFFIHNEHLLNVGRKMSKSLRNIITIDDLIAEGYQPLAFRLMVLKGHYRSRGDFSFESLQAASQQLDNLRAYAVMRYQIPQATFNTDSLDEALADDLATPRMLSMLPDDPRYALSITSYLDKLLGLQLAALPDITRSAKALIAKRQSARLEGDFITADQLREVLFKEGIILRDSGEETFWQYLITK